MLSQGILDHYRCPASFLDFSLSGPLSADQGYFRLGASTIAYGRTSSGTRERHPRAPLHDVLQEVATSGSLHVPFDPTEVIDNLRLERYLGSPHSFLERVLKEIYYYCRPLTNRALRQWIQRFRARGWQESRFPHWPVDTTVEQICESLLLISMQANGVEETPFIWFWPRGLQACVTMTHDVETAAGRDFCPELMDIDDSFQIKSSFQIVPEDRYVVPERLLDTMRSRGFEIVVQDLNHDGRLFDNRQLFLKRAARINSYAGQFSAKGFRSAVLYRNADWYGDLDFSFDMSIPNVASLDPQPGGCCTVMPYFIGDMLELPVTTTQDYTLLHILGQRSIELWKTQLDLILKHNGLAEFIIHPDYIQEQDTKSVYLDLLVYLQELQAETPVWIALPHEIDSWWRMRNRMSVVRKGSSWQIEGEGADRAILAFAKIADNRLVYELARPVAAA